MVNRRQLLKLSALGTASFAAPLAYSASKITMAYNTGNPIGSTSPKDLSDNARNLDYLVNGGEASYVDRKGVPRKSWKGMEGEHNADQIRRESEFDADQAERVVEFNDFLESSGFETPVDYIAGLNITRPTQVLRFSGELYRAKDASLPFTTTTWVTDEAKFFSIGDAALRQDMADPSKGVSLSAWQISKLTKAIRNAGDALSHFEVPIWAFADQATGYVAGGDPATWNWGPAIIAADTVINTLSTNGGCIVARAGTYGVGSQATIIGLGKALRGHGVRATEFRALPGYTGDMVVFSGSSYCTAEGFKIVGGGGAAQRGLYMPYRPDVGVILQNRIKDVHVELVATGVRLDNPVHCSLENVRTTRDCTLYGLQSEFIAGVGTGQGGTNLNLVSCWFQADATTGRACYINSNWQPLIIGCQFEHAKDGLYMRSVPGANVISPQFEDCGQHLTLDGCTNPEFHSPKFDSATSPDLLIATQSIININGGKGAKFFGISSINDTAPHIDFLIRFMNTFDGTYPDDVLIDTYASAGNKGLSGDANVPILRMQNGGAFRMQGITLSQLRVQLPIRTSAPTSPALGEEFNADGVSWQPVTGGRARVIYSGAGSYTKIVNF